MIHKFDNPLHSCELKFQADSKTFEGYASVFGSVDSYGDTIQKGAFKGSLAAGGRLPLMLYGHNPGRVIGKWVELKEDKAGLRAVGEFTPDHTDAANVRASMKHGAIDGLSIGFRIPAGGSEEKEGGGRLIKKIELVEISVVSMPAEGGARVDLTSVKSEIETIQSLKDAEAFLRDAGMWSRSMACAFVSHVKALVLSDSVAEREQITAQKQAEVQELGRLLERYSLTNLLQESKQ